MSADNGIYMLKTPSKTKVGSFEYRVREVHAIENIYDGNEPNGINERNLLTTFGGADVIETVEEAFSVAQAMHRQACSDGNVVEYGVLMTELCTEFPKSKEAQ